MKQFYNEVDWSKATTVQIQPSIRTLRIDISSALPVSVGPHLKTSIGSENLCMQLIDQELPDLSRGKE